MHIYRRIICALLLAAVLLVGCDTSTPGVPTTAPSENRTPLAPPAGTTPEGYPGPTTPSGQSAQPSAYPGPTAQP